MHASPTRPLTLVSSRWLRLFTLCVLYFAQGVPWGFVTIALVAVLSEQGATTMQTGSLIALAGLPWTFKLAWGPMIDSFGLPSLGRRRPWIVLAQVSMAATLLIGVPATDVTSDTSLAALGTVLFLHNCFASLQDVATDALAIDVLPEEERGRANGLMWASKLVGISAGGVGLVLLTKSVGAQGAMRALAALMLVIALVPTLVLEREGERRFPWSARRAGPAPDRGRRAPGQRSGPGVLLPALLRSLRTRSTFVGLFVALGAGACCAMVVPLNAQVFTQRLGWSAETYAAAHATFGTAGKLLGAIGGGVLCSRLGSRRTFTLGALASAGTVGLFAATSAWWGLAAYPHKLYLTLLEASVATTGVAFLTLSMNLAWTAAAATQFTLYMTLSNVGRTVAPLLAGLGLSHGSSYAVAGLLAVLPITLLPLVDERSVRRRRDAEADEGTAFAEPVDAVAA